MATTPIPNMNPTGVIGSGYGNQPMAGQQGTGFSGTGGPGSMGFGNAMNQNPTQPGQGGGTQGANPFIAQASQGTQQQGGSPQQPSTSPTGSGVNTANNAYGQSTSQQYWTQDYLEKTFGGGMGSLIYQYLMSNGGYNSAVTGQAVAAQTNAMGEEATLGLNTVTSTLATEGITGGSSSLPTAVANYENQVTTQDASVTAQEYYNMWNQSQQNEANMIQFAATGTAKTLANKPNWEDYLNEGLGVVGAAGSLMSGIGMLGMGGGGTVNTSGGDGVQNTES